MSFVRNIAVLTSLTLALFHASAEARGDQRGYKVIDCPKIPPAYSQMINNLAALKTQIKKEAHCDGVRATVGELEGIVNSERRTRFLNIVRRNQDKNVSPEDADFLRKYAEDTSNYSLRLMTVLQGKQDCFNDDGEGKSMNTLTSVVYEATSLLSKVAGPYGVPIAIGGNILTGVLKGIQTMNENRVGFRFEKSQDRQAFTEQLCIYHNYRKDVDDLLRPQVRIDEVNRLELYLTERLDEVKQNCAECAELLGLLPEGLGRETKLPPEVEAAKKAADAAYQENLGSETIEIAISRNWAAREIERLEALRDLKLRSIGPQEVMFLKNDLDRFFFQLEAPKFLEWQTKQAIWAGYRFENSTGRWIGDFVAKIEKRTPQRLKGAAGTSEQFDYVVKNRSLFRPDELMHFESETLRARDELLLSWSAWTVIEEYCRFFSESRALTTKLATGLCSPDTMKSQIERLPKRATYEALMSPELWNRPPVEPIGSGRINPGLAGGSPPPVATPLPPITAAAPPAPGNQPPPPVGGSAAPAPEPLNPNERFNPAPPSAPLAPRSAPELPTGPRPPGDVPLAPTPTIPPAAAPGAFPPIPVPAPKAATWTDALERDQNKWRADKRKFEKK